MFLYVIKEENNLLTTDNTKVKIVFFNKTKQTKTKKRKKNVNTPYLYYF